MTTATTTTTHLAEAAKRVLDQVENGELFASTDEAMANNTRAMDELASAADIEMNAGFNNRLRLSGQTIFGVERVTAEPKRAIATNGTPFWTHDIELIGGDGFRMTIIAYYCDAAEAVLEAEYQAKQTQTEGADHA